MSAIKLILLGAAVIATVPFWVIVALAPRPAAAAVVISVAAADTGRACVRPTPLTAIAAPAEGAVSLSTTVSVIGSDLPLASEEDPVLLGRAVVALLRPL